VFASHSCRCVGVMPAESPAAVRPPRRTGRLSRLLVVALTFFVVSQLADPLLVDPLRALFYARRLDTPNETKARQILERLHEIGPAGERAVLSLLSDPVMLRRRRAVWYIYHYRPEQAEALLFEALRDRDDNVWRAAAGALYDLWARSPVPEANRLFLQGVRHMQAERWEEAIALLTQAYEADPEFFECQYLIAQALDRTGQPERAVEVYRQTVEQKPEHFNALRRLSALYDQLGETAKAHHYLKRAREVFPYYTGT